MGTLAGDDLPGCYAMAGSDDYLFPAALLGDVAAGKYDQRIQAFALEISAFRAPVPLSWGHEMENVTGRYPWASHNAAL